MEKIMEGIGLDNMLGAEEVEKLFSNPEGSPEESGNQGQGNPEENENNDNNEENNIAEVDFSDLLGKGNQPEGVGNGETEEGKGGAPKSGSGTPTPNVFSSITKALRDEGVLPDLSDDKIKETVDAESFRKLFEEEVSKLLNERQKRIENALNGGATNDEVQMYNQDIAIHDFLIKQSTLELLNREGEDGEKLRKQVMFQDYINRGFTKEKAEWLIEQSLSNGSDKDDAKEALKSCEKFYADRISSFQQSVEEKSNKMKEEKDKQYSNLKKGIIDTESFFGGIKVDKATRQKAYDVITKPVVRTEDDQYLTELQQYQRENPEEFMKNVALLYALTDKFKTVDKLTKSKINDGLKKGFAELESVLNTSRRNSDGTLNLANTGPEDLERENWTLA